MSCNNLCWRDRDTGELFCPANGWVAECPKKDAPEDDFFDEVEVPDER